MSGRPTLLSCPFCGGDAEMDTQRGYMTMPDARLDNAVAIYCTQCSAEISLCRADHRGEDTEALVAIVTEAWNKRATPTISEIERFSADTGHSVAARHCFAYTGQNGKHSAECIEAQQEIGRAALVFFGPAAKGVRRS